jgi:hypothetical protein
MKSILVAVLVAVPIVVIGLDLWFKRRSLRRNKRNLCAKCAIPLQAFQSELIPVSGGELHTQAFVCLACARRDKKIWRVTWIVIGLCFIVAFTTLWLDAEFMEAWLAHPNFRMIK